MNNLNRNIYNVYRARSRIDIDVPQKYDVAPYAQVDVRNEYRQVYELNRGLKRRINEMGGNASIFPDASTTPYQESFSLTDFQMLVNQNECMTQMLSSGYIN